MRLLRFFFTIVFLFAISGCSTSIFNDNSVSKNQLLENRQPISELSIEVSEYGLDSRIGSASGFLQPGESKIWRMEAVKPGRFIVDLLGPSGADFDLYVRRNQQPTFNDYDCRPYEGDSTEQCELTINSTSTMYMMVYGFSGSGSYSLKIESIETNTPRLREVYSPVVGQLTTGSCSGRAWCFNQHRSGLHGPGDGVGGADDTYSWDLNLNTPYRDYDNGLPVYPVAPGRVAATYGGSTNAGGSHGQLLIEHSSGGQIWWSGYLHLSGIQVSVGQSVSLTTALGKISDTSTSNIPNHLHLTIYEGSNTRGGLRSVDARFIARGINSVSPSLRINGQQRSTRAQGGSFSISGSGFTPNATVARHILLPNDLEVNFFWSTDSRGNLSWDFNSDCASLTGTYFIWVVDPLKGRSEVVVEEITPSTRC